MKKVNNFDKYPRTIDLRDSQQTGKGKYIINDGASGNAEGNYQIDINININLNLGEKINPETLKELEPLLDKILRLKNPNSHL